MICPNCQFEQADGLTECLKCGVIFAKWRAAAHRTVQTPPKAGDHPDPAGLTWRELLCPLHKRSIP